MYIVFDGGYSDSLGVGTWAVVLVENETNTLLEYGHMYKCKSTDVEYEAARRAVQYAAELGVDVIYGDHQGCLVVMNKEFPQYGWRWVPSAENVADCYTKIYPEDKRKKQGEAFRVDRWGSNYA